ncbi:hypothetical protein, partial [Pseudomonas aeruginosa]|uniref:hypothetical protein n=1 Tax=Pseudomonas aeruginosa TaxID=287 RepID=UPI003969B29B
LQRSSDGWLIRRAWDVADFMAGNINSVSTWIVQFGMKVFENQPLAERLPESVLQADGSSATATGS